MPDWVYFEPEYVRRRFNRLAPVYTLLDWVALPPGMRRAAVHAMQLRRGNRVLEVGCGTGRNFPLIFQAIGSEGHVYGVDFAEEMLRRARRLCEQRGWKNVTLLEGDATGYTLPESVDAALFSLSYSIMKHNRRALEHAWNQLQPGGRLVLMDGKTPSGPGGKLVGRAMFWISRASVLGNPDERPWEDLRALTDQVTLQEKVFGTHYVCQAIKPLRPPFTSSPA